LLEVARAWRDAALETTLVVIGTRTAQASRIAVLESGVDAYLVKPLVLPELRARVRAALRRFRSQNARVRRLSIGEGTIDLEARVITTTGRETRLTPTECGILEHLAAHLNQTVPRNELVRTLWGSDPQKGAHSLRLFIRRLRQKLEPDPTRPQYLVTDPAIGYRLQIPVQGPHHAATSV
jgi:two-component system KDP operon response regulator KdpE